MQCDAIRVTTCCSLQPQQLLLCLCWVHYARSCRLYRSIPRFLPTPRRRLSVASSHTNGLLNYAARKTNKHWTYRGCDWNDTDLQCCAKRKIDRMKNRTKKRYKTKLDLSACKWIVMWLEGNDYIIIIIIYVYVTTWSTVDYTSVTSILHCRPCCNKLISWPLQTWLVTA